MEKDNKLDTGESIVSLDDGLETDDELFDLAELLCLTRGAEPKQSRYWQNFQLPDDMQAFNSKLKCGQLSLLRLVKPMVGPALQELQSKITEDKYWIFSMAKSMVINFTYGSINFCWDLGKSILTSRWADVKPDENTTIIQMIISGLFIIICLRFVLRLLVFLAPLGNFIF